MQDSRSQKAALEKRARPVLRHGHQIYPQQAGVAPQLKRVSGSEAPMTANILARQP